MMNIKNKFIWIPKKETVGFMNGIIASCMIVFLPDAVIPFFIRIVILICGICVVSLSSILIRARSIYEEHLKIIPSDDDDRETKAWESANALSTKNNEIIFSSRRFKRAGTLEYWIPRIYIVMIFLFIIGGICLISENIIKNTYAKQEQEKILIKTSSSIIYSVDSMLRQQINHINNLNIDMNLLNKKIDSLIFLNKMKSISNAKK